MLTALIEETVRDAWKDNDRMTGERGCSMGGGVISALAAIGGALVGGLASLASTWVGERSRHKRDLLQREIAKRETTYSEFIERTSTLYVASATHRIDDDDAELAGMVSLYAVSSRIRLFASDQVIMEAEKVVDRIVRQYGDDNLSAEQLRMSTLEKRDDPLKAFSVVCRHELHDIQRGT
jgi:hypothetical protein